MTDRDFLAKSDFSFEITGTCGEIEIRPYIDVESECVRTLIASFQVDSLEMIESARIPLSPGKNHVPFQQTVRIVKPLLWNPVGGTPSLYRFTVVFHQHGEPCYQLEKRTGIRFVEADPTAKIFRVNGRSIRLTGCASDFAAAEKSGSGTLVRLQDTDPELSDKLEYCGDAGLMAVLELSGRMDPAGFRGQPGVCLFTAASGSDGERCYRQCSAAGMVPFFTHRELNELMD